MNGVVTPEEFDFFHEMVITQELCRTGARGFNDGNLGGMNIGLPAILYHAKPDLRKRVADEVLSGKKLICLAISEAFAGSDVAGLKTTAVKSPDGKYFIVNGMEQSVQYQTSFLLTARQARRNGSQTVHSATTSSRE